MSIYELADCTEEFEMSPNVLFKRMSNVFTSSKVLLYDEKLVMRMDCRHDGHRSPPLVNDKNSFSGIEYV